MLTQGGEPVPFALIRFDRQYFGAIAVQCDGDGAVRLSADLDFVSSEAVVAAFAIEPGTLLGCKPLVDCMHVIGESKLRIEHVQ